MANSNPDTRSARPGNTEPRLWELDHKGQTGAAARPDSRPTSAGSPLPTHTAASLVIASESKPVGTVIGATLRFKGELRADEDFVLQGQIEGSIHHSQSLTIGVDGVVKGDSRARIIIVEGTVDGDLYALDSISIRATAKVQGNLLAPRVAIADGASFNGKIDMASAARAVRSMSERQASNLEDDAAAQMPLAAQGK